MPTIVNLEMDARNIACASVLVLMISSLKPTVASRCTNGTYLRLDEKQLQGNVFMMVEQSLEYPCYRMCLYSAKCLSFNWNREISRCELNKSNKFLQATDLVSDSSFIYGEIIQDSCEGPTHACADRPCGSSDICVPVEASKEFICLSFEIGANSATTSGTTTPSTPITTPRVTTTTITITTSITPPPPTTTTTTSTTPTTTTTPSTTTTSTTPTTTTATASTSTTPTTTATTTITTTPTTTTPATTTPTSTTTPTTTTLTTTAATTTTTPGTTTTTTTTTATIPDFRGCYEFSNQNPLFDNFELTDNTDMDHTVCADHCIGNGQAFYGLEKGRICRCDVTLSVSGHTRLADEECDQNPCSGDDSLRCGGAFKMAIFEI